MRSCHFCKEPMAPGPCVRLDSDGTNAEADALAGDYCGEICGIAGLATAINKKTAPDRAKDCYAGYGESLNWKLPSGSRMPQWHELEPAEQKAWEQVVKTSVETWFNGILIPLSGNILVLQHMKELILTSIKLMGVGQVGEGVRLALLSVVGLVLNPEESTVKAMRESAGFSKRGGA